MDWLAGPVHGSPGRPLVALIETEGRGIFPTGVELRMNDLRHGFRFGDWAAFPLRNVLAGPSGEIRLEPKVMQVLEYLACHAERVVEREVLLHDIWDGRAVTDEPLTRCIAALRRALGDSSHDPKYVQTIPKRGYRLVCPVEPQSADAVATTLREGASNAGAGVSVARRIALYAAVGMALIAAIVLVYQSIPVHQSDTPELVVESATTFGPPTRSIAVLPFENRSTRVEDAYFAQGIQDDILNQLVRLSSLEKVISRTSTERYRETTKPVPLIGEELGVATILEGGVQRSGDRVRIHVQLIDANDDKHLWAGSYDRKLTAENLFAIQSDISHEVVAALNVVLTDEEGERLNSLPTDNLDAYREHTLGRREMAKRTPISAAAARAHFKNAIELDPEYTQAYVGLADALVLIDEYSGESSDKSDAKILAVIHEALALDPFSGEAYTSLAKITRDAEQSERYFLRAIQLSPNYATAYHWYMLLLNSLDRREEALASIRKAAELDPMQPVLLVNESATLSFLGRDAEARATLLKGIERNPEFPPYYAEMSFQLETLGRTAEAMKWNRAAVKLAPLKFDRRRWDCQFHLEFGDARAAEECYDALEDTFPETAYPWRIDLYLYRAQHAEASKLLERIAQSEPGDFMERYVLAPSYFYNGELEKAQAVWQEIAPELFGDDEIVIASNDLEETICVGFTLYADGRQDRGNYLSDQALSTMQTMHRTGRLGYWALDVFIYAWRDERQKAIAALREAIDTGWRMYWWRLRSPLFDHMRDEPQWNALVDELEADMERQRQWFEDHENDPLF